MEKMTKKVALSTAIEALSADEKFAEVCSVFESMIEQLSKRSSRPATRKPTAKQKENEAVKDEILALIAEGVQTIPTMMDAITTPTTEALTSQRVSALLTQLKRDGLIVRNDGKTATYSIVEQEEAVEVGE